MPDKPLPNQEITPALANPFCARPLHHTVAGPFPPGVRTES
jgi:hypothetical protein